MTAKAGRFVGPGSGPYHICLSRNQVRTLFARESLAQDEADRKLLGCGSWACAWSRGDKEVVKITRDTDDVAAFEAAKGLPHIVPVKEMYELAAAGRDERTGQKVSIYGIVAKRVEPLPPMYADWVRNKFCRARISLMIDVIRSKDKKQSHKAFKVSHITREKFDKACEEAPTGEQAKCRAFGESLATTFEKLYRRGIQFIDMHEDNLGMNEKGQWVAIDLGVSDIPMKERPRVLSGGGKPPRCKIIR